MRTLVFAIVLWCSVSAQATLTLVQRETFQGVGTLTSGSPGNLGVVSQGTFYKRAVGPRLTNDATANSLGWSADMREAVSGTRPQHVQTIQGTAAASTGMWSAWFYFGAVVNNGANRHNLCQTRDVSGNQIMRAIISSATGTFWYNQGGVWTDTDSGVAYPIRQWFELRQTWGNTSGNTYQFNLSYRLSGSTNWIAIRTGTFTFAGTIKDVQCAGDASVSSGLFVGRYGMPSVYGCAFSDASTLISDVADPSGPWTWYVNPSTGSDSNDGVTSASAWQTVGQINTESQYGGMFQANSYATGDTLIIDTSGSSLDVSSTALTVLTPGLNIRAANGQTWAVLKPYTTISSGAWSLVSGLTKVYQASSSAANAVLWENDKWLNHPTGATLASVTNSLQTTAGSFWTDGTTMYLHPFGDTNPGSDGKTYDRSTTVNANSAVNLNVANLNVQDLYVRKTSDVDKSTGIPNAGYSIGCGSVWQGTNRIAHCYVDYFGKHGLGLVANSAPGEYTVIDNVESEQGSPYGSQTPFVSFCGSGTTTNITHVYTNCVSTADTGVIGSTNGTSGSAQAFYSHQTSSYWQFEKIILTGCNFALATVGSTDAVKTMLITNCIFGGDQTSAGTRTVTRSKWLRALPIMNVATATVTIANCLMVPTNTATFVDATVACLGTLTLQGNTIDLTGMTSAVNNPGVMVRTGASVVTNRDNIYIFPNQGGNGSKDWAIFKNFTNSDTIVSGNNLLFFNGQSYASYNYNGTNRTLAQWQGLGFDTTSITNDPALRSDYRPQPWSKCRTVGVDIGPAVDFTGKIFPVRKTIGAYEWQIVDQNLQMGVRY